MYNYIVVLSNYFSFQLDGGLERKFMIFFAQWLTKTSLIILKNSSNLNSYIVKCAIKFATYYSIIILFKI